MIRKNEYQADRFAHEKGMGETLQRALITLCKENKSPVNPDPM